MQPGSPATGKPALLGYAIASIAIVACSSKPSPPPPNPNDAGTAADVSIRDVGGDGRIADAGGSGPDLAGPDRGTPFTVAPRRGRIAVGDGFACALDAVGQIVCWGQGLSASAPAGGGFSFISAGISGVCAIDAIGAVVCWTRSNTISSTVDKGVPAPPFKEVVLGGDQNSEFACALRDGGQASCWRNQDLIPLPELTTVPSGPLFTRLSPGVSHVCGLQPNGLPVCWGRSGEPALSGVPSGPVTGDPSSVFGDIASGVLFSCALNLAGHPKCWGTTFFDTGFPALLSATEISAARSSVNDIVCTLLSDGVVRCVITGAAYPGPPDPSARYEEISVGVRHVCAVKLDQSVVCWSSQAPSAGTVSDVPAGLHVLPRL